MSNTQKSRCLKVEVWNYLTLYSKIAINWRFELPFVSRWNLPSTSQNCSEENKLKCFDSRPPRRCQPSRFNRALLPSSNTWGGGDTSKAAENRDSAKTSSLPSLYNRAFFPKHHSAIIVREITHIKPLFWSLFYLQQASL